MINRADKVTFQKMYQIIKYVLSTKNELKIEPQGNKNEQWVVVCLSDNDDMIQELLIPAESFMDSACTYMVSLILEIKSTEVEKC